MRKSATKYYIVKLLTKSPETQARAMLRFSETIENVFFEGFLSSNQWASFD